MWSYVIGPLTTCKECSRSGVTSDHMQIVLYVLMQNEFWHYFNLVDCSLQHMKLCTFIILAEFKFGIMDPIRQIDKLKSSPKYQRIPYFCFTASDTEGLQHRL